MFCVGALNKIQVIVVHDVDKVIEVELGASLWNGKLLAKKYLKLTYFVM